MFSKSFTFFQNAVPEKEELYRQAIVVCVLLTVFSTRKRITYEATPCHLRIVDESKESCTDAKRTETCVAPRQAYRYADARHVMPFLVICYLLLLLCSFVLFSSLYAPCHYVCVSFIFLLYSTTTTTVRTVLYKVFVVLYEQRETRGVLPDLTSSF